MQNPYELDCTFINIISNTSNKLKRNGCILNSNNNKIAKFSTSNTSDSIDNNNYKYNNRINRIITIDFDTKPNFKKQKLS